MSNFLDYSGLQHYHERVQDELNKKLDTEVSPNIIDKSAVTSARFTNANGSIQSFSSGSYYNYWRMTDYIDVSQHIGEYISITNHNGYCFYNSSKTAIAGSGESLGMNYPSNSSTAPILIPEGASYVRLVYWYRDDAIQTPMANFGQTLESYSEYGSKRLPAGVVYNRNLGEKIDFDNIVHDAVAEYVMPNNLMIGISAKSNYQFNTTTGEEEPRSSGYSEALTDWIEVKPSTNYYGNIKRVGYYDENKTYLSYVQATSFKTPPLCHYIRCVTDQYFVGRPDYGITAYLVEGTGKVDNLALVDKYIPAKDMEQRSAYKSVLHRLESLNNPLIPTAISFNGDSNTYGLESGDTGRRIQNCWANLTCARILEKYNQEVAIVPFGRYGTWAANYYSGTATLTKDSIHYIDLSFYGSILKVNFGSTYSGTVSITIDDDEPITFNTTTKQWVATDLTEGYHKVRLQRSGSNVQVSSIIVKKYVTAVNNGVSGIGSSSSPTGDTNYDLYVIVLGTNDRGSGNPIESMEFNFARTIHYQEARGANVILITPTPATDTFETGASQGHKMADIDRGIKNVCGYYNHEPLSFYEYLINYCRLTGTSLNSLLTDTLHIKETTHRILFNFLCDKFGLGQPADDLMPQ